MARGISCSKELCAARIGLSRELVKWERRLAAGHSKLREKFCNDGKEGSHAKMVLRRLVTYKNILWKFPGSSAYKNMTDPDTHTDKALLRTIEIDF